MREMNNTIKKINSIFLDFFQNRCDNYHENISAVIVSAGAKISELPSQS